MTPDGHAGAGIIGFDPSVLACGVIVNFRDATSHGMNGDCQYEVTLMVKSVGAPPISIAGFAHVPFDWSINPI